MKTLFAIILCTFFSIGISPIYGAAWWGEDYRPPNWVLKNGGTIIKYSVVSGNPKRYKAVMYKNGAYVEVEFGKSAYFDDAKNGNYTIVFYRCAGSCHWQKFHKKEKIRNKDKRIATIAVTARPGETITISFNPKTRTASIVNRSSYKRPKTAKEITIERATAAKHATRALNRNPFVTPLPQALQGVQPLTRILQEY